MIARFKTSKVWHAFVTVRVAPGSDEEYAIFCKREYAEGLLAGTIGPQVELQESNIPPTGHRLCHHCKKQAKVRNNAFKASRS